MPSEHEMRALEREISRHGQRHHLRMGAERHNLSEQNINRGTQYERDWFNYPLNVGTLAAGATFNGTINIMADSDFELMQITAQGNVNGATEPFPNNIIIPVTLFLTDGGTGRQLMQAALPINLISGRGDLPFILPQERYFVAKASIQLQVQSFSGSTWNNIWINFIGAKLFARNP